MLQMQFEDSIRHFEVPGGAIWTHSLSEGGLTPSLALPHHAETMHLYSQQDRRGWLPHLELTFCL